jgi:CubicO group peptidase (beta-lactamase class C family)
VSVVTVNGFAEPPFERVRAAYQDNFARYDEVGSALCVKVGGQTVVDLFAGQYARTDSRIWTKKTLVNVWSTTKGIVAICYAMLVSRGLMSYDDPVSAYWPEFAANGKGAVTIAELLSHRAALAALEEGASIHDLYAPQAAATLASANPLWPPGLISGYHILTFGALVTELFRRIEGRSLKAFVRDEWFIARNWDFHIGLPADREDDCAETVVSDTLDLSVRDNPSELQRRVFTSPLLEPLDANTQEWKRADLPSANGFANAKAIAEIYASAIDATEPLLSAQALSAATAVQYEGLDLILTNQSRWGCGFVLNVDGLFGPNERAFGHTGLGGSFGFADPELGLSMSYTPNCMGYRLRGDPRGRVLIDEVFACLQNL